MNTKNKQDPDPRAVAAAAGIGKRITREGLTYLLLDDVVHLLSREIRAAENRSNTALCAECLASAFDNPNEYRAKMRIIADLPEIAAAMEDTVRACTRWHAYDLNLHLARHALNRCLWKLKRNMKCMGRKI